MRMNFFKIYLHFKTGDSERALQVREQSRFEYLSVGAGNHGLKIKKTKTPSILIAYSRVLNKINFDSLPSLQLADK